MTVVELDGVSFGYATEFVVENVSLTVEEGDFLGIVGPNGSGKSTLLKLILGLLKPDEGQALLFGEPARSFDDGERIGYVAQDATRSGVEMPITVGEVVLMGRYPHVGFGRVRAEDRERAQQALETVGIAHLADRRITKLSGGQRQRAYIARALAAEADLLVLDEPTVGVDAESVKAFYELIDRLNDEGLTVILIEHDIGRVLEHASTVLCINREMLYLGAPEELLDSGALASAYGATPALVQEVRS